MTTKSRLALTAIGACLLLGTTLNALALQRNRDREAAQQQNYAPKFASEDEQKMFAATQSPDPGAKLAAADAFLAKYPNSQLAGYANRFRMESYVAQGKFKEALDAGEIGFQLESKYVEDLIKQAEDRKSTRLNSSHT